MPRKGKEMGNNIDLVKLLGLPTETNCENCGRKIKTNFEDYDIECGGPDAARNGGMLTLDVYCHCCGHEGQVRFSTSRVIVFIGAPDAG
jgi:hypothetical protein